MMALEEKSVSKDLTPPERAPIQKITDSSLSGHPVTYSCFAIYYVLVSLTLMFHTAPRNYSPHHQNDSHRRMLPLPNSGLSQLVRLNRKK